MPAEAKEEPRLYQRLSEETAQKRTKARRARPMEPDLKVIEGKKYLGDEEPIPEDNSEPEEKD